MIAQLARGASTPRPALSNAPPPHPLCRRHAAVLRSQKAPPDLDMVKPLAGPKHPIGKGVRARAQRPVSAPPARTASPLLLHMLIACTAQPSHCARLSFFSGARVAPAPMIIFSNEALRSLRSKASLQRACVKVAKPARLGGSAKHCVALHAQPPAHAWPANY